jgi:sulfide:quinone oxidoreductase
VWVPFGLRTKEEITFDVRAALARHGVRFVQGEVRRFSLEHRTVSTTNGDESYDYLLIATGMTPNYQAVPGLGPRGYTQSFMTLPDADKARVAFEKLCESPGPVVVGGVQGASCIGAVYEFVFQMAHELKRRGLSDRAPLTFLTAAARLAPFDVGDFGSTTVTEYFFEKLGIRAITGASVQRIERSAITLGDGRTLPFAYALLVPSVLGINALRECDSITDASGFVRVNDHFQTLVHPEVFAAGAAVAATSPEDVADARQVPNGCRSEAMAKIAASNIVARIRGEAMVGPAG